MMLVRAAIVVSVVVMLSACGRGAVSCVDPARYADRDSIPPLVVPEGLEPPDLSRALVIPPPTDRTVTLDHPERPCLELPPGFEDAA